MQRLNKRLERQSQASAGLTMSEAERKRASGAGTGNWFGETIKSASGTTEATQNTEGGVGKYLKRVREVPASAPAPADEPSHKKRKAAGWGDFSGW